MPSLAFFKIGKAVRYRYGDVLAFIETRRATSTLAARALKSKVIPAKVCKTSTKPNKITPKRKRAVRPAATPEGQQRLF
jgi:hypothetical protein